MFGEFCSPLPVVVGNLLVVGQKISQCRFQLQAAVPGVKKCSANGFQCLIGHLCRISVEECVQFDEMRILTLFVDLPDESLTGPLSAQEGVFAPDEIDVALPQQLVVSIERQEGDWGNTQFAMQPGPGFAEMAFDGCQWFAGGHQAFDGRVLRRQGVEQFSNRGRVVAEQTNFQFMVGVEGTSIRRFDCDGAVFAQQATAALREAGEVEVLDQRQAGVRGGHAVAAFGPAFCGQVFKIDPAGLVVGPRHSLDVGFRQVAGEGFDDDIGDPVDGRRGRPMPDFDPRNLLLVALRADFRAQWFQAIQVVHP